ncbi:MAG: hypothetical protein ACU843_16210, partial [Gammaproteobacteria bacterium]
MILLSDLLRYGLLAVLLPWAVSASATDDPGLLRCDENPDAVIWTSPRQPFAREPLKVMAVLTDGPAATLLVTGPDGRSLALDNVSRGGPPWSLSADLHAVRAGSYRIEVLRGGKALACRRVTIGESAQQRP